MDTDHEAAKCEAVQTDARPLEHALNELSGSLSQMEEMLNVLYDRVLPLLAPIGAELGEDVRKESPARDHSDVVERVLSGVRRLTDARVGLRVLVDRMEV